MSTHSIWYPLFDTPVDLRMSREQLQCIQDVLAGRPEPVPGWSVHFAAELEKVLVASLKQDPPDMPSRKEEK